MMEDLKIVQEFFSQPIPGQDALDTISMDIPLFLRMLEYAKEDAQEDVDLHDVTQRATELSKTKSFLSMEDYNEIIAAPQEIEEDAFEDTWALNRKKAQSFIDQYKDNPFRGTDVKYAQAYLNIDDIADANKYWSDFVGKIISRSYNMESLKEIVKNTLTEKKKKRDRCLRIADRRYKKPSAYKSGSVVRCRQGDIWKGLKEAIQEVIQEDESLYKWFKRTGTPGKEGGWVDCNAPIRKDGKITGYKSCGRKKGEKRAKYPSCRPTAAKCKNPGKGTKWGKTK
jgi:hypothetical protein